MGERYATDYLIKQLVGQPYPMISPMEKVFIWWSKWQLNIFDGSVRSNYGRYWAWFRKGDLQRVIKKQAEEIAFVIDHQFRSEPAEPLAKKLVI